MTLTALVLINAILGTLLVWGLSQLLVRGIHADRRDRKVRAVAVRALPAHRRNRVAA